MNLTIVEIVVTVISVIVDCIGQAMKKSEKANSQVIVQGNITVVVNNNEVKKAIG